MATPEREINPTEALAAISRKLELADEIENPIERTLKRENLLEQYDDLQAEIAADTSNQPQS
jgi:hypothetical protein